MMNLFSDVEKATVEGLVSPTPTSKKSMLRVVGNNKKNFKTDQNADDDAVMNLIENNFFLINFLKDSFRKKLRSMVLTVGIKAKLKEYHQKLIRSRLNGKSAYGILFLIKSPHALSL